MQSDRDGKIDWYVNPGGDQFYRQLRTRRKGGSLLTLREIRAAGEAIDAEPTPFLRFPPPIFSAGHARLLAGCLARIGQIPETSDRTARDAT